MAKSRLVKTKNRILFVPSLGKGFGHIQRCFNIIDGLNKIPKNIQIYILLDNQVANLFSDCKINIISIPPKANDLYQNLYTEHGCINSKSYLRLLKELISSIKPDIVVYDFIVSEPLFELVKSINGKNVIVLRELKDHYRSYLIESGLLNYIDKIIIPNHAEVFTLENTDYSSISVNVGPIFISGKFLDRSTTRKLFNVSENSFWIIATIGGGGYINEFEKLVEVVSHSLDNAIIEKKITVTFFSGIYNNSFLPKGSHDKRIQIKSFDKNLSEYYNSSDLVISYAGYNSFYELAFKNTPALLIPSYRALDDQFDRISKLTEYRNLISCDNLESARHKLPHIISNYSKTFTNIEGTNSIDNGALKAAEEINSLLPVNYFENPPDSVVVDREKDIADFNQYFSKKFFSGKTNYFFMENLLNSESLRIINKTEKKLKKFNIDYKFSVAENSNRYELNGAKSENKWLKHINLRITQNCNSKCIYCYHWRIKTDQPNMPTYKVLDIAFQAKKLGAKSIVINGGEPTLHPDFFEIINSLQQNDMEVTINTNGKLFLKDRFIRKFPNKYINVMITILSVEDVGIRGVQDWSGQVIKKIKSIRKNYPQFIIRTNIVITKKIFPQLEMIIDSLLDARPHQITLNLIDNVLDINNSYLYLDKKEIKKLYFTILPKLIFKSEQLDINIKVNPIFFRIAYYLATKSSYKAWKQIVDIMALRFSVSEEIDNFTKGNYGKYFYQTTEYCQIPQGNIYLMANGDIYPCLKAIGDQKIKPFGNLYFRKLSSIVSSRFYREFQLNAGKHEICNVCNNAFVINLKQLTSASLK